MSDAAAPIPKKEQLDEQVDDAGTGWHVPSRSNRGELPPKTRCHVARGSNRPPPVHGIVHEVSCAHASVVLCMYHDDNASVRSLDGSMHLAHGSKQACAWVKQG